MYTVYTMQLVLPPLYEYSTCPENPPLNMKVQDKTMYTCTVCMKKYVNHLWKLENVPHLEIPVTCHYFWLFVGCCEQMCKNFDVTMACKIIDQSFL